MSDVDDPSSSSGEEYHASDFSSYSSDHAMTMHLYLYQNEHQKSCGYHIYDGPSLQSALQLLNHNDPNFTFVEILISDDHEANTAVKSLDDVKSIGRAIARSATVENLEVMRDRFRSSEFDDGSNHILLFLKEMRGNRSIRHIKLYDLEFLEYFGEEMFRDLQPFLENNPNLKSIVVDLCRIHDEALCLLMIALINRDSPLDYIAMASCYLDDEAVKEISSFFKDNPKMTPKKISLPCNEIGDLGCYFLSEVIGNDECKLEEISLIGNDSFGLTGLRSIISAAAGREIPLKTIEFPADFDADTPDQLQDVVEFFSAFPAFVPYSIQLLCRNFEVSGDVLHALGNMIAQRSSPLGALHFHASSIASDGVVSFLRAFMENHNAIPEVINIVSYSSQRASVGDLHLVLGPLLRSSLCSLKRLQLSDIGRISDNDMIHIITSLNGNTTLKCLNIFDKIPSACVADHLTALLCDETTIMSTYNSNHTLNDLGNHMRDPKLCSYLKLNEKNPDKGLVATAKVIEVHFAHNFQPGNFDSMKAPVLAQVVSFVNRGFHVWNESFNVEIDVKSKGCEEKEVANNNLTVNFLMVRNISEFLDYVKPRWERERTCSDV